jgi:LysR family transcriptional activator of nhaA
MRSSTFNYRHLHYFWVVAQEGGMTRAAERLGMAVQTVSAQVRELEAQLGHALFKPAGRGLELTEAGRAALEQADRIFAIGERLPDAVRDAAASPAMRLSVGVADSLPKLLVRKLMAPLLHEPSLRLVCQVDEFNDLLADLALHRLDVVLADRPAPPNPNLRVYNHSLGSSPVLWYATAAWASQAETDFPRSLAAMPVLLPTSHSSVRGLLDHWFTEQGIRPKIVGEFEDSALLTTFGAGGMGVFPAPEWMDEELRLRYGVQRVGASEGVSEHFFAIDAERRIGHPLVQRLIEAFAPSA